jgi:hypothetical protein
LANTESWVAENSGNTESWATEILANMKSRVTENSVNMGNRIMNDSRGKKPEEGNVLLQAKGQLHSGAQGVLPRHKNADCK